MALNFKNCFAFLLAIKIYNCLITLKKDNEINSRIVNGERRFKNENHFTLNASYNLCASFCDVAKSSLINTTSNLS